MELPSSVRTALAKPAERVYLFQLEKDLILFIHNVAAKQNPDPYVIRAPFLRNSYYRLLSHQLCQYYQLQHWNNTANEIVVTPTIDHDYEAVVNTIRNKLLNTLAQFIEVAPEPLETPPVAAVVKPKMIIRKKTDVLPPQRNDSTDDILDSSKIESERASKEALYLKVREQIFKDQHDDDHTDSDEALEPAPRLVQDNNIPFAPPFGPYSYPNTPPLAIPIPMGGIPPPGMGPLLFLPPPPPPVVGIPGPLPPLMAPHPVQHPVPLPGHPLHPYLHPPGPGQPSFSAPPGSLSPYLPYYPYPSYAMPPYDKETERRLLNNPYIILPEDAKKRTKKKFYPKQR